MSAQPMEATPDLVYLWVSEALENYANGCTVERAVAAVVGIDPLALDADVLEDCVRLYLQRAVHKALGRVRKGEKVSDEQLDALTRGAFARLMQAVDVLVRVTYDGVALQDMTPELLQWHMKRTKAQADEFTAQRLWFKSAVASVLATKVASIAELPETEQARLREEARGVWG